MTPMVRKNFEDDPKLRSLWEKENMVPTLLCSPPREAKLTCFA
jgi:hypothetical protein